MQKAKSGVGAGASIVSRMAAGIARLFYRLDVVGERPPATGPLLIVANHPNSLLDTALVTLATGRAARFLAKSTLFDDPKVAWLVRASGAIPVYRQQDAVGLTVAPLGQSAESGVAEGQVAGSQAPGSQAPANAATFEAAEGALAAGNAIALFPEGVSHVRPGLAPLKTGAARLALGAARRLGRAFPLVPVGITLDEREIFRSTGVLVVGAPVAWDDLAASVLADGEDAELDHDAVRALTARIDAALRAATASYESWDGARFVRSAERVHAAAAEAARLSLMGSGGGPPLVFRLDRPVRAEPSGDPTAVPRATSRTAPDGADAAGRLSRYHLGAALLRQARTAVGDSADASRARLDALRRDLRAHERGLAALHLVPGDLAVPSDVSTAASWVRRRLYLPFAAVLALAGAALGWVPYRLTGVLAKRIPGTEERDVLATAKTLVGVGCFGGWLVLLAGIAGALGGWVAAVGVLGLGPLLLVIALVAGERGQFAWRDARRFLTLRKRPERMARLRARQAGLAREVEEVVEGLELGRD